MVASYATLLESEGLFEEGSLLRPHLLPPPFPPGHHKFHSTSPPTNFSSRLPSSVPNSSIDPESIDRADADDQIDNPGDMDGAWPDEDVEVRCRSDPNQNQDEDSSASTDELTEEELEGPPMRGVPKRKLFFLQRELPPTAEASRAVIEKGRNVTINNLQEVSDEIDEHNGTSIEDRSGFIGEREADNAARVEVDDKNQIMEDDEGDKEVGGDGDMDQDDYEGDSEDRVEGDEIEIYGGGEVDGTGGDESGERSDGIEDQSIEEEDGKAEDEEDTEDDEEEDGEAEDEEDTEDDEEEPAMAAATRRTRRTCRMRIAVHSDGSAEDEEFGLDLRNHQVLEGDPLDVAVIPKVKGAICARCQSLGKPGCVPVWHAYYKNALIHCENCVTDKKPCSFAPDQFNIGQDPQLRLSSAGQALRNLNNADKHVSNARKDPSYMKTSGAFKKMVKAGWIVISSRGIPSVSKELKKARSKGNMARGRVLKRKEREDEEGLDGPNPEDFGGKVSSSKEGFVRPSKKIAKLTKVQKSIGVPLPSKSQDTTQKLTNIYPFEEVITDPKATPLQLMDAVAGLNLAHIHNAAILATFHATVKAQQAKGEFLRREALCRIEEGNQPVAGSSGVKGGD